MKDIVFYSFGDDTQPLLVALRVIALLHMLLATYRCVIAHRSWYIIFGTGIYAIALLGISLTVGVTQEPLRLHTLLFNVGVIMIAHHLSITHHSKGFVKKLHRQTLA